MIPAPVQAPERQKEPSTPKGTIKVNVNLVNVLVSVLDENKRPAPNLRTCRRKRFRYRKKACRRRLSFLSRRPSCRWIWR